MKTHQPKLKTQLFSCGFFRHCTQTALSPTTPHSPTLPFTPSDPPHLHQPPPPPPPPSDPPCHRPSQPDSESSSSSTSQSFTQWKFPLQTCSPVLPLLPHTQSKPSSETKLTSSDLQPPSPPPISSANLQELFHAAELQLTTGSDSDQLAALHLLERALVPNPPTDPDCPPELMRGVVRNLKSKAGAKPATKILLALCLAEGNRHVAVEAGAVAAVVETALEMEGPPAERALAALELMCTVAEGAAEVRAHALAVPAMVTMMGRTSARGKEYAISVLAVIYGGVSEAEMVEAETEEAAEEESEAAVPAPPEEVARAVTLALQGDCSARGRRKGAQLLKVLQNNC
ncbi:E3 ubiquitin-protein ligase PUB23 [Ziziphus jujuba]|uniref:E3 ubiquitin-protein ligase PUB23 n=2 Tax=Ziziphus jujuba TaxID=326968 RepID=A0ABM3IM44_ZIZJJ|nr:E3 ubiquitin-protein ligase PUB23 [Ziziphus jujuba]KAH7524196.1 hypothetical protein FEM48_Zijuj06G0093600 [Ziziphus jujuba var. spinosa]